MPHENNKSIDKEIVRISVIALKSASYHPSNKITVCRIESIKMCSSETPIL